jgi:hypothetical protein
VSIDDVMPTLIHVCNGALAVIACWLWYTGRIVSTSEVREAQRRGDEWKAIANESISLAEHQTLQAIDLAPTHRACSSCNTGNRTHAHYCRACGEPFIESDTFVKARAGAPL